MKLISELLNAKEPLFSLSLKQLENASHNKGVDIKLGTEIMAKAHKAMDEMGLDRKDTTGEELYQALINQAKLHDEHLAKSLGATDPTNVEEIVPLALERVKQTDMPTDCWVLKKSVAKEFLRKTPPKNIMKKLGYRSVDSMLKKENISEIYGALRFAEDEDWLNEFNEHYKSVAPSDFETREIEIVQMPKERWGDIAKHFVEKKKHLHTHLKEMGVVVVMPSHIEHMSGIATKAITLSFHYYNEIRLYSAFFKFKQVQPNFGEIFVETLIADPDLGPVMSGNNIHWRVIQRYFGKLKDEYHPEIFEPHVQPEDLHWRKAEELMYQIDPELKFWKDLDYVGLMYDGKPVTFNLMDVSLGYSNGISYDERYIYHFREALWNEVFVRYMGQGVLEEQVLNQLDNDMIKPENL